ncbi:DNA type IV secretion system protein ComB10 [Helicobacter cappadocius]|uniref:DNA type IV secretion system protein ComB10 n=2 Tax=Helicobacter cappadocius TaxID=3063998 RepID=UPI00351DE44E
MGVILNWIKTHKLLTFFVMLITGFFVLVAISKLEIDDEEFENKTKYPIEDYLYQNSKESTPSKISNTQEKPKEEKPQESDNAFLSIENKIKSLQKKIGVDDKKDSYKGGLIVINSQKNKKNPDGTDKNNKQDKNSQFDYSKASKSDKARLALLAKRLASSSDGSSLDSSSSLEEINNGETLQANKEKEYGVDSFSNFDKKDIASNENKLLRTITADRMIPAILITPISSQIGGNKIVAQVESDVYASMGRAVLIPKGSRVIGFYNNNNKIGEYRLEVIWNRIITPQGINIILSDAKGADVKGYAGLVGVLHKKSWERYGLPLALSTLSNGLLLSISSALNNKVNQNGSNFLEGYQTTQMLNSMKADISNIISQILREQIRIKPIITIKEGSRIFISPNTDIFFPVPKNGEVNAEFFKEYKPPIDEEDMSDDENEF